MGRLIAWTGKGSWYLLKAGWPLLAVYLLLIPTLVETAPASLSQAAAVAGPGLGVATIAGYALIQPGARPLVILAALYAGIDAADVIVSIASWSGSVPIAAYGALAISVVLMAIGLWTTIPGLRSFFDENKGVSSRRSSSDLHGSSDWVSRDDVRRISAQGGLIIGQETEDPRSPLVTYPLEGHGITVAPTRSGKGVGFIIPNLLAPSERSWRGPWVVIDPKAESVFIAGARREEIGHAVHVLDPFLICDERSRGRSDIWTPRRYATFNPLDAISRNDDMAADINSLMDALLPPPKQRGESEHFRMGASRLITGLIAYVCTTMPRADQHLGSVYDLVTSPQLEDVIRAMSESSCKPAATAASLLLQVGDRERGSFISTAQNALAWLDIPQLRKNVETSSFSLDEIIAGTCDVFVCIPPHRLEQSRIWMRLWATMPLTAALKRKPKDRVLLMIDEAPLVGKLDPVVNAFRVAAGMNVSCWLISQSLPDLEQEYGKDALKSLISNAECIALFEIGHASHETAEEVSKMIGESTFLEETASDNSGSSAKLTDVFSSHSSGSSSSRKEIKRRLILADEIKAMRPSEILVLQRSKIAKGPIRLWQSKYFERSDLKSLAKPNPYR